MRPSPFRGKGRWPSVARSERFPRGLGMEKDSRKSGDRTTGIYTFFGAVQTDEGIQPVKLTVKEFYNDGQEIPQNIADALGADYDTFASVYDSRVLYLDSIENETEASAGLPMKSNSNDTSGTTVSTVKVSDLYRLVNSEYQKYLLQRTEKNLQRQRGEHAAG